MVTVLCCTQLLTMWITSVWRMVCLWMLKVLDLTRHILGRDATHVSITISALMDRSCIVVKLLNQAKSHSSMRICMMAVMVSRTSTEVVQAISSTSSSQMIAT